MQELQQHIYRMKKHDWTPLLRFGGFRTRSENDGFHKYPYGIPSMRTFGVKYKDANGAVLHNAIACRNTYTSYATKANDTLEVKYDVSKITGLWYRYSNVSEILVPFNQMPLLKVISLREHKVNFGDLDLSGNPLLSHFEVSVGGSIDSITFHPEAPLEFFYLDKSVMPTSVVDECFRQAVRGNKSYGRIINQNLWGINLKPSNAVCEEADILIQRNWNISQLPSCTIQLNQLSLQRGLSPYRSCNNISDNGSQGELVNLYSEDATLLEANELYQDQSGTIYAPADFYSDGNIYKYWDGIQFTSHSGQCSN